MPLDRLGGPLLALPRACLILGRRLSSVVATALHRATLGRLGKRSIVRWGARFDVPGKVFIGDDCLIWPGVHSYGDGHSAPVRIGNNVQVNPGVYLDQTGTLEIADGVLISEEAAIYTHDHGLDPHSKPAVFPKEIRRNAWIGMRCVVLAKCQVIGENAVIGACSVVTRDVPDGAIVAGMPARIIGWQDGYTPAEPDK